MSLDIHGWVEVTRLDEPERSHEHAWTGVLNIGALVDAADVVSEQLFGISKSVVAGEKAIKGVAANRGLPPNPSIELRQEIERIRSHERRFGGGEFGGYTFATWQEITAAGLHESQLLSSEWQSLFGLVEQLERDARFSGDKIRLVTYYSW